MARSVTSVEEFEKILKDCGNGLLLVHFSASWSPQCKQMDDVIEELSKEYQNAMFVKVEAEDFESLSKRYKVTSVPTILFFKNGTELERLAGANAPELTKKVQHHASTFVAPLTSSEDKKEDLNDRLKRLVNSSNKMLFMKGTPEEPRCGFSKQIVKLLSGYKYGSFDILTDNEVRQGLKTFSNWPTFPQFYVNGELVGGLDIIKELAETDELQSMLEESESESLDARLKKLINSAKVMIVMKGNAKEPRCGFSRQLCHLLENYPSVKFSSFDVLQDQEVREGIKKYSNWPTFPQVYVNGELVGGLDIIKELHENGELAATLEGS